MKNTKNAKQLKIKIEKRPYIITIKNKKKNTMKKT